MSYTPKAILFLLICAAAAFFVHREDERGSLAAANRTYVDWLLGNSKSQLRDPSVTLLTIDEEQAPIFQNWPPAPLDFSVMLRRLQLCDPKVVAAEPVLRWDDVAEGELDILLTAGLAFGEDHLLLGSVLQFNSAAEPLKSSTLSLLRPLPDGAVEGDLSRLPEFTNVLSLPDTRLCAANSVVGFTGIDLGDQAPDGDALRAPLLARVGDTVVPSFVLLAAMLEMDAVPADVKVELGEAITVKDTLVIPIDASGALNVFTGLRAKLPVSKATILVHDPAYEGGGSGGTGGKSERDALKSRIVVLGMNDKNSRVIPAGRGGNISRAELFALAIATIQSGRYIQKLQPAVRWAVWGGIVLFGLWLLRMPRKRAVGLALLAIVLYFAGNMILFQTTPRWIPPAVPVALLGCLLVGALTLSGAPAAKADGDGDPKLTQTRAIKARKANRSKKRPRPARGGSGSVSVQWGAPYAGGAAQSLWYSLLMNLLASALLVTFRFLESNINSPSQRSARLPSNTVSLNGEA